MNKQALIRVAIGGAVGGLLIWLFGLTLGKTLYHPALDPFISTLLGAGASVVFVFLIANSQREDHQRLFAISLVAGFFWQPVWESAEILITRRIQERREDSARQSIDKVVGLVSDLPSASGASRKLIVADLGTELERAGPLVAQVNNVNVLAEFRTKLGDIYEMDVDLPRSERWSLAVLNDQVTFGGGLVNAADSEDGWVIPKHPSSANHALHRVVDLVDARDLRRGEQVTIDSSTRQVWVGKIETAGKVVVDVNPGTEPFSYYLVVGTLSGAPLPNFSVVLKKPG